MSSLDQNLAEELAVWTRRGLARREQDMSGRIDWVTNDYLGLSRDERLVSAAQEAAKSFGAGGRSARLLGGGCPIDRQVEEAVAEWLGAEAGLLFPTGYQANCGLIGALAGPADWIVSDEQCHASLIDGARLSRARVEIYQHLDCDHLQQLLRCAQGARRRFVLTEGVFSMEGACPDLARMSQICAEENASLIVDEAHAIGLLGPLGAGAWAACGADPTVLAARIVTGGKALGAMGAVVVGSSVLREQLLQRARSFMFTTAVSPTLSGAFLAGITAARESELARVRTLGLAADLATALGLPAPAAAIVSIPVGDTRGALDASAALQAQGLDVRAIRPPTVAPGSERLRVVCHAHNTPQDLEMLVGALQALNLPSQGLPQAASPHSKPLVVLGTDTDVGKTIVSALLMRAAARQGPVRYWKPVQTGSDSDTETVRELCEGLTTCQWTEPTYSFALPASPHEAAHAEGREVDTAVLDKALVQQGEACPLLIIEPAGGLLVPLNDKHVQIDWLAPHRLDSVLVARSGLGTLNHTLLSLEALSRRNMRPKAIVLVGPAHESNRRTLAESSGLPVLELPHLERLNAISLDHCLANWNVESIIPARATSP